MVMIVMADTTVGGGAGADTGGAAAAGSSGGCGGSCADAGADADATGTSTGTDTSIGSGSGSGSGDNGAVNGAGNDAGASTGDGGATGAGGGGGGGSDWYTTFEQITLTPTLTMKGEKGGNPKCDAFESICHPIYLEKGTYDDTKWGIGGRPPIFPTLMKAFCLIIIS